MIQFLTHLTGFTSGRGCVFLSQILLNALVSLVSQHSLGHYKWLLGHTHDLHRCFPGTPTVVSTAMV